jgi:hypothetical protein
VSVSEVPTLAIQCGFKVEGVWEEEGRWFAELHRH